MNIILVVLVAVTCLGMIIAGLLSLLRNPHSNINRWFFGLAVFVGLWTFVNFVGSTFTVEHVTNIAVRLDYIFALILGFALYGFTGEFLKYYTDKKETKYLTIKFNGIKTQITFILTITFIVILLLFGNMVSIQIEPELMISEGNSFILYILLLLILLISSVIDYVHGFISGGSVLRTKIKFILFGFSVAIIAAIFSNLISPEIFESRDVVLLLNIIGYLGIFTLVVFMYLAITKGKVFDIRLVIARSLAYVFSLGLIALITSVIIFVLASQLEDIGFSSVAIRWFFVYMAVTMALLYQPLKKFFDKLTNRIFFQDAYTTRDLLDEFNQAIVTTIDLKELLAKSSQVIEKYIKSEFVAYALVDEEGSIRVLHDKGRVSEKLIDQTRGYLKADKSKVFITDTLDGNLKDLKSLLQEIEVGMVVRITNESKKEGIGYILLGNKKTGSVFNSQDVAVMKIIGDELAIATQNALSYEEIQQFNVTLQDKVDEATKKLRKANERLKQLDQTKDDFISMASHQLRTPLTSAKGYISMVMEGDAGKVTNKQKDLLDQAFLSSQRMVYLIADLLNVSRLRTGKFIIEPKPTNLAETIEAEIKQLEQTASGKEITFKYNKPKSFPTLMFDETKMRQVIMNFADNALHYTPKGGKIEVNLEDKSDIIEFKVVDNGIGVPKTEQHHLFNKFYRANNAKKARPDGTGLGLFMAKKVVVAQGGAIIFNSAEGKGSTFGFTFEKKKLDPEHYKGPKTDKDTKLETAKITETKKNNSKKA